MKHILIILAMLIGSTGFCLATEVWGENTTSGIWNNGTGTSTGSDVQEAIKKPGDNPGTDAPVGGGSLFLLALAGGYGLIRFKRLHGSKKQSSSDF